MTCGKFDLRCFQQQRKTSRCSPHRLSATILSGYLFQSALTSGRSMHSEAIRKILITGSGGFVGKRLAPFLRAGGREVIAGEFDILDFGAMVAAIRQAEPDAVIHLAGLSHMPTCEANPSEAFRVNLAGTASLLEALRTVAPQAWLLFASTAQVYGVPAVDLHRPVVISESCPIFPQNTYARTKWTAELLIEDACRRESLRATVFRLFNHTHKSQSPDFLLPYLYKTIVDAQSRHPGARVEVPVGNLHLSRDIGSVQDLVSAFAMTLDRGPASTREVFNICSGVAQDLSALARGLATRLGVDLAFVVDGSRIRPGEPEIVIGSHDRLTQATGWQPRCTNESDLLDAFLAN
jgi:GDP-4-dehydro-6-deoxy-D-mannose reductase